MKFFERVKKVNKTMEKIDGKLTSIILVPFLVFFGAYEFNRVRSNMNNGADSAITAFQGQGDSGRLTAGQNEAVPAMSQIDSVEENKKRIDKDLSDISKSVKSLIDLDFTFEYKGKGLFQSYEEECFEYTVNVNGEDGFVYIATDLTKVYGAEEFDSYKAFVDYLLLAIDDGINETVKANKEQITYMSMEELEYSEKMFADSVLSIKAQIDAKPNMDKTSAEYRILSKMCLSMAEMATDVSKRIDAELENNVQASSGYVEEDLIGKDQAFEIMERAFPTGVIELIDIDETTYYYSVREVDGLYNEYTIPVVNVGNSVYDMGGNLIYSE